MGRRPAFAILLMPGRDLGMDVLDADAVRPEHQAAAIARKAETVQPHDIYVAGSVGLSFLEDAAGFVDRGEQQLLLDFDISERLLRDPHLGSDRLDDRGDLKVGMRGAIALFVAIPTGTGLLAVATHLHQPIGDWQFATIR